MVKNLIIQPTHFGVSKWDIQVQISSPTIIEL